MTSEAQQIQEFEVIFAQLKEMLHLTDEIMIRLNNTFFDSVAVTLKELKSAIEVLDYPMIELHAHSIKGSAASLCYTAISESAQTIEKKAHAKDSDECEAAFGELAAQFDTAQHNYALWTSKRG